MKSQLRSYLLRTLLVAIMPCALAYSQPNAETKRIEKPVFTPDMLLLHPFTRDYAPYTIDLEIEQDEEGSFYLVATIDFINGSYTASPLSNNDFTGLFHMEVAPDKNLVLDDEIIEIPRSVESIDPHERVPVNWVREKTIYKRKLHMKEMKDFKSGGNITFTIEPSCTFEVIPFMISYTNGMMAITPAGC
jgi:hypothetical protein